MADILIVDDEPAVRRAFGRHLRAAGYVVREANSANEALAQIEEAPPDVLLLDLIMLDGDGYDLLYRLRHHPGEQNGLPRPPLSCVPPSECPAKTSSSLSNEGTARACKANDSGRLRHNSRFAGVRPVPPCVVISGEVTDMLRDELVALGVHVVLEKPVEAHDLLEAVASALESQ